MDRHRCHSHGMRYGKFPTGLWKEFTPYMVVIFLGIFPQNDRNIQV